MSQASASSRIVVPRRAAVSATQRTRRPGVNVATCSAHTPTTEVGATTRTGPRPTSAARRDAIADRICTVLPRPMSSARTPPSPADRREVSQACPCR